MQESKLLKKKKKEKKPPSTTERKEHLKVFTPISGALQTRPAGTVTTAVNPAPASRCAAPLLLSQCPPAAEETVASRSRTSPKQGVNFQVGLLEKFSLRKDKIKVDVGVNAE